MVKASNQIAQLIPSEVLAETTPQARARVISIFIKVSERSQEGLIGFCSIAEISLDIASESVTSCFDGRILIPLLFHLHGYLSWAL